LNYTYFMKTEYEIKFKLKDKKAILNKLAEIGAQDLGENKETDIYLSLGPRQLRVRKIGQEGLITIKKAIASQTAKVREELEVKIADVEGILKVFGTLGFYETRRKEKLRHTFKLDEGCVLIDKLPFIGYYIELEAFSEDNLVILANKAGLDYTKGIKTNYGGLFNTYCKLNQEKFKGVDKRVTLTFSDEKLYSPSNSV